MSGTVCLVFVHAGTGCFHVCTVGEVYLYGQWYVDKWLPIVEGYHLTIYLQRVRPVVLAVAFVLFCGAVGVGSHGRGRGTRTVLGSHSQRSAMVVMPTAEQILELVGV